MKSDLVHQFSEVLDPDWDQILGNDLKLDCEWSLSKQPKADNFVEDRLRVIIVGGLPFVDDLKLEIEVDFGKIEVFEVAGGLFAESDVVCGHDDVNFFGFGLVDPEGAVQTEGVFLDVWDYIWRYGDENWFLFGHCFGVN